MRHKDITYTIKSIAYLTLKDYKNSISYFKKHITEEIITFREDYVDVTAFLYNGIANFETRNFEEDLLRLKKQLIYSQNLCADAKYYKVKIYKSEK